MDNHGEVSMQMLRSFDKVVDAGLDQVRVLVSVRILMAFMMLATQVLADKMILK